MKYSKISYKGKELKRISRKKVNSIINKPSKYQGLTIYALPVEANPGSPWINGFFEIEIENIVYRDTIDYYNELSEIEYYNCVDELGKYLKYYIEVDSRA